MPDLACRRRQYKLEQLKQLSQKPFSHVHVVILLMLQLQEQIEVCDLLQTEEIRKS